MRISPKRHSLKQLQADYSLPCSTGLLRASVEARAAGSSGSRVWGCWAAPGGPTSWCWRGTYCGRRGEAGCGRWAPPSWTSPQRAETVWAGETGAEMITRSQWWDGGKTIQWTTGCPFAAGETRAWGTILLKFIASSAKMSRECNRESYEQQQSDIHLRWTQSLMSE